MNYDNMHGTTITCGFWLMVVETKAGFVGQVKFADKIVWESYPNANAKEAEEVAKDKLSEVIHNLFVDSYR